MSKKRQLINGNHIMLPSKVRIATFVPCSYSSSTKMNVFKIILLVLSCTVFSHCQETIGGACTTPSCSAIPHALCQAGVCTCEADHFDEGDHTICQPSVPLGNVCDIRITDINQCSRNAHCSNGTCACYGDFFENSNKCFVRLTVGATCNPTLKDRKQCETNTVCQDVGGHYECVLGQSSDCKPCNAAGDSDVVIALGVLSAALFTVCTILAVCVYTMNKKRHRIQPALGSQTAVNMSTDNINVFRTPTNT